MHNVWHEVLDFSQLSFYRYGRFITVEVPGQPPLACPLTAATLEAEWCDRFPADSGAIRAFAAGLRTLTAYDLPTSRAHELTGWQDKVRFLTKKFPLYRAVQRWGALSLNDFADKLRSPALSQALRQFWPPGSAVLHPMALLSFAAKASADCPLGAGGRITTLLTERLEALGGVLQCNARISRIETRPGGRVCGLQKGSSFEPAHYVVAACDYHSLFRDLLNAPATLDTHYAALEPHPALHYLSFGLCGVPQQNTFPAALAGYQLALPAPLDTGGGKLTHYLQVVDRQFDPTLAPDGHSLLTVLLPAHEAWWRALQRSSPSGYQQEKARIQAAVLLALEQRCPGIASACVMQDMATPATFYNYTHNYRSSYAGWLATPAQVRFNFPRSLRQWPGLFLAGHWQQPGGGVPPAVLSARNALQLICAEAGKKFHTEAVWR